MLSRETVVRSVLVIHYLIDMVVALVWYFIGKALKPERRGHVTVLAIFAAPLYSGGACK